MMVGSSEGRREKWGDRCRMGGTGRWRHMLGAPPRYQCPVITVGGVREERQRASLSQSSFVDSPVSRS